MTSDLVRKIADTVLYEGYILYPYRSSAIKNRRRFDFGVLVPQAYSETRNEGDAWTLQTECLVEGDSPVIDLCVRFLHLAERTIETAEKGADTPQAWQEAVEREVIVPGLRLSELIARPQHTAFSFAAQEEAERDAKDGTVVVRRQQALLGDVTIRAGRLDPSVFKLTVLIRNITTLPEGAGALRDDMLMASLVSTHTILEVRDGEFASLIDPPAALAQAASGCRNIGAWPVLVGSESDRHTLLSAPVILYDYPYVAPESLGDFCDGTEMDEMLALRVMTLTDDEKRQMRNVDRRAREILERTESLTCDRMSLLHGVIRGWTKTVADYSPRSEQ